MKINIILIIIVSSIIWALYSFFFLNISDNNINYLENKIINISKQSSSSVVSIIQRKHLNTYKNNPWSLFDNKISGGSGFFINKKWIIITNNHVVENNSFKYIVILNSWKEFEAEIIYSDKIKDIALLKINHENTTFLDFIEEYKKLQIWQFVIAIWNTLAELHNSVSFGIISWLNRSIENNYTKINWLIQTDTSINPWNSWWPLINLEWKVIWINTLIIDSNQSIWFSIEMNKKEINHILDKIKIDK